MSKLSVLVADEHQMVCEGLCLIISENKQIEVVGQAYNGASTLTLCQTLKPDILLLDVKMPGSKACLIVTEVRHLSEQTKIICLTGDDDPATIQKLIGMGVDGYLFKHETGTYLIEAIFRVGEGQAQFSKEVWTIWKQALSKPTDSSFNERSVHILRMVLENKTNTDIAQELSLSERTIGRSLKKLKSKLAVESRAELIAKAKWLIH